MAIRYESVEQHAYIESGTILFRLTSPSFSSDDLLLNGKGTLGREGRYNVPDQLTSYASNNVLLCIAEILFHMTHDAMNAVSQNHTLLQWNSRAEALKDLVIFNVRKIENLIHINSSQARNSHQLSPITVTHPYMLYTPLQQASHVLRINKEGIVYPSSRHSKDCAVALFGDHTASLDSVYTRLKVLLWLIDEDTWEAADTTQGFDPYSMQISHSRGHYSIIDDSNYTGHKNFLVPDDMPREGYIDFIRLPYTRYPNQVVIPLPLGTKP